ncbi:hypothetical protein BT96DRAFT_1027007 [Gymnopus androsaceus JB14]|uniref:Uncharacterized protein n=1 Tax=Gymnopus androsaceus JB14 TaxID=1447944 RepID=A0A6A4GEY6_9AGAR|nr:hypothetical protein BT96DRAFT_1027007 [Gymnopus androsaceus JB14]
MFLCYHSLSPVQLILCVECLACFSRTRRTSFRPFTLRPAPIEILFTPSPSPQLLSRVKNFASRCRIPVQRLSPSNSAEMSSYKTTVTSGSQSTVTFASFGLYELEDGDNWSYEIDIDARTALTTRVSSREEVQTNASPTQATALPLQRSEVSISAYSLDLSY